MHNVDNIQTHLETYLVIGINIVIDGNNMSLSPASLPVNINGGYYQPGGTYDLSKKLEVFDAYKTLSEKTHPMRGITRM